MKTGIIILCMSLNSLLQAQSMPSTYYEPNFRYLSEEYLLFGKSFYYYRPENKTLEQLAADRHLEGMTEEIEKYGKHAEKYDVQYRFNQRGKILSMHTKDEKINRTYLNDTLETKVETKSKKHLDEYSCAYDQGKIKFFERKRDGKIFMRKDYNYTTSGKLASYKTNYKGTLSEMRHSYNERNQLTRSEFYRKGKLKNTWVYECKPEGQELVASSKNELISSYCKYYEESADGSYVEFTRTIRNNKPYLTKKTFNRDSLLLKTEMFYNDSVLTQSEEYDALNRCNVKKHYAKGIVNHQEIIQFNEAKQLISIHTYGGKKMTLSYFSTYAYDGTGRIVSHTYAYGKKQNYVHQENYFYNEEGLLSLTRRFMNDNLRSESRYSFSYFNP